MGGGSVAVMGLGSGRRRAFALLAALALAAACGGGGDDGGLQSYGPGSTTTTVAGATPADPTGTAPAVTVPGGSAPPTVPVGDAGSGGGAAPGQPAAGESVIGVGSLRVGQVGPPLLRPGRGDRVVVEVRAQDGAAPAAATIQHVVSVLGAASGKPVAMDGVDLLGGGARDWSAQEIVAAASGAAQVESGRQQVVLRLLFLRGTFEGQNGVLGVAVAGDVAAIFSDRVDAAAGVLVDPGVVEDAVTMHEVGHLLGLVDIVLGTGRGDPEHPGHSRNDRSVMFWQVESNLVTQLLDGGIPRDFDDDDRAELAQIRAG
jgi:hypothetical protein